MTEKSLVEQIQNTQTLLETLSAEQADLGKKMALAADDADSASLITLAHLSLIHISEPTRPY